MTTSAWVRFFSAAGIPTDVGATYAITFAENRIQPDMLLELNKEYLRDMGITRMGDVIAILRHAKKVHENTAREKVLNTASGLTVPVAAVTGRITTEAKPTSPATRMLERYTRNATPVTPSGTKVTLKRKFEHTGNIDNGTELKKRGRQITFGPALPPNYSNNPPVKNNVFSRLGNTCSTAEVNTSESKTIFSRLGQKTSQEDLPKEPEDALEYEGILKSTSSFKKISVQSSGIGKKKVTLGTMRADEAPISIKEKLAKPKQVKFSNKVEYKEIDPLPLEKFVKPKIIPRQIFNKPERRLLLPKLAEKKMNTNLKSVLSNRLGSASQVKKVSINKSSVFNRLGTA